jgi:YD repeat-containing protein
MRPIIATGILMWLLVSPAAAATAYTYDTLGRLATVTYDNGKEIIYTYDAAGNRTQVVIQASQ